MKLWQIEIERECRDDGSIFLVVEQSESPTIKQVEKYMEQEEIGNESERENMRISINPLILTKLPQE